MFDVKTSLKTWKILWNFSPNSRSKKTVSDDAFSAKLKEDIERRISAIVFSFVQTPLVKCVLVAISVLVATS